MQVYSWSVSREHRGVVDLLVSLALTATHHSMAGPCQWHACVPVAG